jgi:hypothetical protein
MRYSLRTLIVAMLMSGPALAVLWASQHNLRLAVSLAILAVVGVFIILFAVASHSPEMCRSVVWLTLMVLACVCLCWLQLNYPLRE